MHVSDRFSSLVQRAGLARAAIGILLVTT